MKKIFFLVIIFFIGCSGCNQSTADQYKKKHIEFHKKHIEFIATQKKSVEEEFNKLLSDLDRNADSDVVIYDWQLLNERVNEMRLKNEVYISDIIISESTTTVCLGMKMSNDGINSILLPNKVDVESFINSHNYIQAKTLLTGLKNQVMEAIDEIGQGAEDYLKLCS